MRKIIHIDMDAFYASVEVRERPELQGRPVVVGGDPNGRGVVASASYEARRFGVRSAMSCKKAKLLCPEAVFLYPRFELYHEVSERIRAIFHEVTPLVEPLSLDEAYLDVTENLLGEPLARNIAAWIKDRIRKDLRLSASAGVGPNKFIAKLASDLRKPDGLVVVPPEKVRALVDRLPVEKLWGVGPATAKRLHALGLATASDIRKCAVTELRRELGSLGEFLHGLSFGEDDRPVEINQEPKSRGSETTFEKDVLDVEELKRTVETLSAEIASSLQEMKYLARTITLKLRYRDFHTITRSHTLSRPFDEASIVSMIATKLLVDETEAGEVPVRLVGVSASGLIRQDEPQQLWLDLPELNSMIGL